MSQFIEQLQQYRDAAYPLIYVQSHEELRVMDEIMTLEAPNIYEWSSTVGLVNRKVQGATPEQVKQGQDVLGKIPGMTDRSVLVLKDYHAFLANGQIIRTLRDLLPHLESKGKMIVFLSPIMSIPVELEKDIVPLDYDLPAKGDLKILVERIKTQTEEAAEVKIDLPEPQLVVQALQGMTQSEAKNAIALAIAKHGDLNDVAIRTLLHEKANVLKKTNLLSWVEPDVTLDDVGGMAGVKAYAETIAPIFWNPDGAETFGMLDEDFPRSVALVGVPGCGKSLTAKALALFLKTGLIRSDFGRIFGAGGGKVGSAENNIEQRNKLVEALAPVIDWWDEAEKGLAGARGESTQNPWEARVAGTLLTWFEEYRARVLVVATINKQEVLPPEMLSRFQKVFFVDLPDRVERAEIFRIHCSKRKAIKTADKDFTDLASVTEGYSGREIRNGIQLAVQTAFARKYKAVDPQLIMESMRKITPVSRSRAGEIEALRQWQKTNNIELASKVDDAVTSAIAGGRRIAVKK